LPWAHYGDTFVENNYMNEELTLISFGNYLLKKYKINYPDGKQEQAEVSHADLENWREALMKAATSLAPTE
jgi:hypothetical protein